jgi:hypothetical protein
MLEPKLAKPEISVAYTLILPLPKTNPPFIAI